MDDAMGDPVSERLARLEAEVGALRGEVAALRAYEAAVAVRQPLRQPVVQPAMQPAVPPIGAAAVVAPVVPSRQWGRPPGPVFAAPIAKEAKPKGSLESDFGSKVLSKVAVVLLLIGAALFLKWAFDNKWIGAGGRVVTGLVAGTAIVLWSERFRKQKLPAFSYALKAVGSGVLYLSLWASFHLYHLVPAWVAFTAMVMVTLWNMVMAWSQDAPVLAGYAMLGAYLTPVLLSQGGNHEVFLFSYLLVIAATVVALVRVKPWSWLLLVAMPVTGVFFAAWYVEYFRLANLGTTVVFILLLWAVFAALPVVAREREDMIVEVLATLGAGAFGALAMYFVLSTTGNKDWEPWCAVGFAAVYLGLTRVRTQAVAAAMHLSLGIVFLTVAIPLKANGRGILLGWMVEAVALLAVSTMEAGEARTRTVLRWLGCGSMLLGVGGVLLQPMVLDESQKALFNREFGMSLGAVVLLGATMAISHRMKESDRARQLGRMIAATSFVMLNVVLLVAVYRELGHVIESERPTYEAYAQAAALAGFCFSGWMMLQGVANLVVGFWKKVALARWMGLALLAGTVIKTFAYDLRGLSPGYRVLSYLALGVLLLAVSFAYQKDWLGLRTVAIADDEVQV